MNNTQITMCQIKNAHISVKLEIIVNMFSFESVAIHRRHIHLFQIGVFATLLRNLIFHTEVDNEN